tara:strand:- start:714 stop:956 length:243 start_codon:yes stop_codon:yes gene_type:complete
MQNLWQRLKPAYKKQILLEKDTYSYLVSNIKVKMQENKFWSDLSVETVRHVVSFTHNSVLEVSVYDLLHGDKFFKPNKND